MITHPVEGFNPPVNPAIPSENLPIPASPDSAEHANQTPNKVVEAVVGRERYPRRHRPQIISDQKLIPPDYFTYFLHAPACNAIKIGRTTSLQARLYHLRLASPCPLVLLAVIRGNCEADLHQACAWCHLHGEWFSATPELLAFIANKAATPCRTTSPPPTPRPPGSRVRTAGGRGLKEESASATGAGPPGRQGGAVPHA